MRLDWYRSIEPICINRVINRTIKQDAMATGQNTNKINTSINTYILVNFNKLPVDVDLSLASLFQQALHPVGRGIHAEISDTFLISQTGAVAG